MSNAKGNSLALILCFLMCCTSVCAQRVTWSDLNYDPIRCDLSDVVVVNDSYVAVGTKGSIVRGRVGEAPLAVAGNQYQPNLKSIAFAPTGSVLPMMVAGGDSGTFMVSADTGKTWTMEMLLVGDINQVAMSSERTFIASRNGLFGKPHHKGTFVSIMDSACIGVVVGNGDSVYAAFETGSMYCSPDAGESWSLIPGLSGSSSVTRLRYHNTTLIAVHDTFLALLRPDGRMDTLQVGGLPGLRFIDAYVSDSTVLATALSSLDYYHVYSTDGGATWMNGRNMIGSTYAITVSKEYFVGVGQYGATTSASIDSIIGPNFRLFGFGKPKSNLPRTYVDVFYDSLSTVVLVHYPRVQLVRQSKMDASSVVLFSTPSIGLVPHSFAMTGSYICILADSSKFDGNPISERKRFVLFLSSDNGLSWDTVISPNTEQFAENVFLDADRNIYLSGLTWPYYSKDWGATFYRLDFDSSGYTPYWLVGADDYQYAYMSGLYRRFGFDRPWERVSEDFEGTIKHFKVTSTGRLVLVSTANLVAIVSTSDDHGSTWKKRASNSSLLSAPGLVGGLSVGAGDNMIAWQGNVFMYSTSGGDVWEESQVPVPVTTLLRGMKFTSPKKLLAVGTSDALLEGTVEDPSSVPNYYQAAHLSYRDVLELPFSHVHVYSYTGRLLTTFAASAFDNVSGALKAARISSSIGPSFIVIELEGGDRLIVSSVEISELHLR